MAEVWEDAYSEAIVWKEGLGYGPWCRTGSSCPVEEAELELPTCWGPGQVMAGSQRGSLQWLCCLRGHPDLISRRRPGRDHGGTQGYEA